MKFIGNGIRRLAALVAVIASFIATNAQALVITIDDLLTTPLAMANIPGSAPIGSESLGAAWGPGIAGLSREARTVKTSGGTGGDALYGIQSSIGDGLAIVAAGPRSKWAFTLLYDGVGSATGTGVNDFGLGLDLSDAVAFTFRASVDLPDSVSGKLTLWGNDASEYIEYDIANFIGGGVDTFYSIPLAVISPFSTSTILGNVGALQFDIFADINGTDATIAFDSIQIISAPPPVPEVSTAVSAAGFALLGGFVLYRNRRARPDDNGLNA